MDKAKLDEKDIRILEILQKDCKTPIKNISRVVGSPITTVYAKIKRLQELGVIKEFKAILEPKSLGKNTTVYIFANVNYQEGEKGAKIERTIADRISKFPNVQEVHLISGEWDLLIKVRGDDIESVGEFIMGKLRNMEGITKTMSSVVFETAKESTDMTLTGIKKE